MGRALPVSIVKSIRQIRRHHVGVGMKPGGFFFELLVHEGFTLGQITGGSWADVTASTLRYIADRLLTVGTTPVLDPAMGTAYTPTPTANAIAHAAGVFAVLASKSESALTASRCPSAAGWQRTFGTNTKVNGPVFVLPPDCRSDGTAVPI